MQIILQDSQASLNPRMRVGTIIGRAMRINTATKAHEIHERVIALMEKVETFP